MEALNSLPVACALGGMDVLIGSIKLPADSNKFFDLDAASLLHKRNGPTATSQPKGPSRTLTTSKSMILISTISVRISHPWLGVWCMIWINGGPTYVVSNV